MKRLEFIHSNRNYYIDFITRSTYHSNAIEGSTLSVNETYTLLFNSNHCKIENAHPFPDGNGRTGRLLINYLLLVKNQAPIVIPVSQRKQYLDYMENNDIKGLAHFFVMLQKAETERIKDFEKM